MNSAARPTAFQLIAWLGIVLIALLAVPLARLDQIPSTKRELFGYGLLYVAFVASASVHLVFIRRESGWRRVLESMIVTAAAFAFAFVLLFLMRSSISRTAALGIFVLALVLSPVLYLRPRLRVAGAVALALIILTLGALVANRQFMAPMSAKKIATTTLVTAFYPLQLTTYQGHVPKPAVRGGGLAAVREDVLLGTGDGYVYRLSLPGEELAVQKLPLRVPLNGEEFAAAVGGKYEDPLNSGNTRLREGTAVQTWRFRVADVFVQDLGEHIRLYASHHYWKGQQQCFVLRLSMIELPWPVPDDQIHAEWHTVYETKPCLPLKGKLAKSGRQPFQGEDAGGRIVQLDEHTVLMSTGEHGLSGLESNFIPSQDPNAGYGKTLAINVESGEARVFTLGHRNPQGLYRAHDGRIWLTEHAARGGDELNLLQPATNYGWPRVTYGTEYAQFVWPLNAHQGHHDEYQKPLYAWVPSIGISNLIAITRDRFAIWQDDLLIGSLATRALYRVKVEEGRVILVEPIALEQRVRDLLELQDGRVLIWADSGDLISLAPSSQAGGALAFGLQCGSCHTVDDGLSHRVGPDLFGMVNKAIGSTGFKAYSPALSRKEGSWTRANLDRFLRDPQAFAPGTTMMFDGIKDAAQRKELIDYLATLQAGEGDAL